MRKVGTRGDTIIEVLFAFTVFSLVAVGGLSLMNQGTAMAQRSLEIGLVRQQIDAQTDALRYLNSSYVADYGKNGDATKLWNKVVTSNRVDKAQCFASGSSCTSSGSTCHLPSPRENPFALDVTKLNSDNPLLTPVATATTYARVRYDTLGSATAEGIWIQAVQSNPRNNFYDFHIRACWQTPGQTAPVTLGTIVRLYVPQG